MSREQFTRHALAIRDELVDHMCTYCQEEGFTAEEAMSAVGVMLSDMIASLCHNEAAIVKNFNGLKEASLTQFMRRNFMDDERDYDS